LETIIFNNEHLFIGNLGHFAVVLAFVSALISTIAYAFSVNKDYATLKDMGRWMFYIHAFAVVLIFFSLFQMHLSLSSCLFFSFFSFSFF
jgi:cytochrome c biogenesis factor